MRTYTARIREIRLEAQGQAAWIDCPTAAVPAPGQYVLANNPAEADAPLATALFPASYGEAGFLAVQLVPNTNKLTAYSTANRLTAYSTAWLPGAELRLRGPLGRGFALPYSARRLALIDLDGGALRLLPLVAAGLANGADVALFSEAPPTLLPSSVEINPLRSAGEALGWADYMAVDVSLDQVEKLAEYLGLPNGQHLPCPGQVLVATAMPCSGAAECGACAVLVHRRWKLVCTDGPVFDLRDLVGRG
jgi:NAD(P)H-flavin reductase